METKKRTLKGDSGVRPPVYRKDAAHTIRSPGGVFSFPSGSQITDSEGHPYDRKSGHRVGGGPFSTVQIRTRVPSGACSLDNGVKGTLGFTYQGPFNTPLPTGAVTQRTEAELRKITSDSTSDVDSKGATAISLCAPTNSTANLATSLAESHREGLPSLPGIPTWKKRTEIARAAGSEFLNAEFGWLPLVDEVKNVRDSARHSRDILKQYHKDEGKNVRRGFSFPESRSSSTNTITGYRAQVGGSSNIATSFFADSKATPVLTVTVETVTKQWFSGAFTYATPSYGDSYDRMLRYGADADHLFGITITPDVLWELTPWSWAVDWFSNAGMVINNATQIGLYGLVMRYGYMMTERVTTATYSLNESGLLGSKSPPPPATITEVSKSRIGANPFGFGVSWEGLSPTQLAITAALGITRL
jgi:hypothetical protein